MPALAPPRSYSVDNRICQGGVCVRLMNLTVRVTLNKSTENQRNQGRQSDVLQFREVYELQKARLEAGGQVGRPDAGPAMTDVQKRDMDRYRKAFEERCA